MSTSFTCILTGEQAEKLRGILSRGSYEPKRLAYAAFAFSRPGLSVAYYEKRGKLLIQGKETDAFLTSVLEPRILKGAAAGCALPAGNQQSSAPASPDCDVTPHFGIDESGKGDYFGPLVVAGVYTEGESAIRLKEMGVRDSKLIGGDSKIRLLARGIRETPGVAIEVVCIGPQRYNELYAETGNLNRLLAWGHARVIAALHEKIPACPRALSDQFAKPWVLQAALKKSGTDITLEQRVRGESDIAVAAASILARDRFVAWVSESEKRSGCALPLGAGSQVIEAARELVRRYGRGKLAQVAKLHFKTTSAV